MSPLNKVLLTHPTLIHLRASDPISWNQLAVTGNFVSSRYGKFSITTDDTSQMLHNFKNITPKAPTQLPIDYDHLSMDPKHPGDGKAAGWIEDLEIRNEGNELWGKIRWTPEAAKAIEAGEYRFVSPSFIKDHTHTDGKKIGTTLLAAAITNHPFLQGMRALCLHNVSAMGDLATLLAEPVQLAMATSDVATGDEAIGQAVMVSDSAQDVPVMFDRAVTYYTAQRRGKGDDEFVRLVTIHGDDCGWVPSDTLQPADSKQGSPLPKDKTTDVESKEGEVEKEPVAARDPIHELSISLMAADPGLTWADATRKAGQRLDLADQRVKSIRPTEEQVVEEPVQTLVKGDKSFRGFVERIEREQSLDSLAAFRLCQNDPGAVHLRERYEQGLD